MITLLLGVVFLAVAIPVAISLTEGLATIGAIIALVFYWLLGLKNIQTGHIGQVTFFGTQRIRGFYLKEGLAWLPFLLMDVEQIDSRIDKTTMETPFIFSEDNVRVSFGITYWWRKAEPYLFLSTKGKDILEGIKDVAERRARIFALEHKAEDCRRASEELGDRLLTEVKEASVRWGIEITKLAITDVGFTPEYEEALEAEKLREYKVRGDAKEMQSLPKRTKKLQDLGLSAEKAVAVDQIQTGRVKKEIKQYDIGENLRDAIEKGIEKGFEKAAPTIAKKLTKPGGKK